MIVSFSLNIKLYYIIRRAKVRLVFDYGSFIIGFNDRFHLVDILRLKQMGKYALLKEQLNIEI